MSPITLTNEVNINNNKLKVDLRHYNLGPLETLLLVDAAPGGIFAGSSFAEVEIIGGAPNANYAVVYDNVSGDILLQNAVPEPSTLMVIGFALVVAFSARRRTSR